MKLHFVAADAPFWALLLVGLVQPPPFSMGSLTFHELLDVLRVGPHMNCENLILRHANSSCEPPFVGASAHWHFSPQT